MLLICRPFHISPEMPLDALHLVLDPGCERNGATREGGGGRVEDASGGRQQLTSDKDGQGLESIIKAIRSSRQQSIDQL